MIVSATSSCSPTSTGSPSCPASIPAGAGRPATRQALVTFHRSYAFQRASRRLRYPLVVRERNCREESARTSPAAVPSKSNADARMARTKPSECGMAQFAP